MDAAHERRFDGRLSRHVLPAQQRDGLGRSSETDWDEETLWRTHATLTDVEAVFRSLKSELGLRPVCHRKQARAEGHLFITVLAYQLVQVLRAALREKGVDGSWNALCNILNGQRHVTTTFRCADGRTLHVRKATRAEPTLRDIYDALGVAPPTQRNAQDHDLGPANPQSGIL